MPEKELAKKEPNEVANVDPTMFEGEKTGFEGTSSETFKTPFLKILQSLSPELDDSNPKYIPGAKAGLYCNSATQQLYEKINVVVLKVEHSLIVWKPERGGFVDRVNKSQEEKIVAQKEGVQKWDAEGNTIMDTIEFFCINMDDFSDIFILSLSAASFKHGRTFSTRLRLLKANGIAVGVSWAAVWNIGVVKESNEKGSWYTIGSTPEFVRWITKEEKDTLIKPAKDMLETAEIDYKSIESEEENSSEEEEAY